MEAAKPAGSGKEAKVGAGEKTPVKEEVAEPVKEEAATYATGSASPAAIKILAEKNIDPARMPLRVFQPWVRPSMKRIERASVRSFRCCGVKLRKDWFQ